jgi:hypothetical protein
LAFYLSIGYSSRGGNYLRDSCSLSPGFALSITHKNRVRAFSLNCVGAYDGSGRDRTLPGVHG